MEILVLVHLILYWNSIVCMTKNIFVKKQFKGKINIKKLIK